MSNTFRCTCGQVWKMIPLSSGGGSGSGGWQAGQSFAMGGPPPGSEFSREVPAGNMGTVESAVKVPVLQSLLMALVALLLTGLGAIRWGWHWTSPVIAAVIAFCLAAWLLLVDSRRLLRTVETVIGKDLDGDGEVGFTVEITDLTEDKKRVSYAHFPARPEQVERFATAALNGWLTVNSPHRLSRRRFTQLRDVALDRGLLAWRCEDARQQGVELTAVGRHVFKRLIA